MFCRAKRIVKRTNFDGSIRYIGQTKNFWGVWEDGDGGESRNSIHHTYEDALEWYNTRGTNFSKDEVILSDN